MSIALNGKWTPAACYTNVRNDRNSILSDARREMGIIILSKLDQNNNLSPETSMINPETSISGQSDNDESLSVLNDKIKLDTFDLVLTEQQWNKIKPEWDTERNSRAKLKPGVWTNEIAMSFFQQYRLPCAFVFKKAKVILSENMIYTIKITGSCKSKKCCNVFQGYAKKENGIEGLTIQITTRDTRTENHEIVKRPLNGKRRKEVQKELKIEGCSNWRKRQAKETMRLGEIEPPILPNNAVLWQARKEGINAELGVSENDRRDLIRTIEEMSLKPEYAGLIHDVGSLPFHVCYSTQAQLYAYKEYCRLNKKSFIYIDSTGSVVQKLYRNGQKSGHIFLYAIVINFDNTTISVHQMLSEKHTTEFIELWLRQWQRSGAPKPKQVVCDFSRALLCAISLAFNNQTIKSYIDDSFNVISKPGIRKRPDTVIRVDVAHFIAAVCHWNCWKFVRQIYIKQFFIRCIALMVECVTFSDFQKIFFLTCVVGLQIHQDVEIDHEEIRTAKDARKKLEEKISVRGINIDVQSGADELEYLKAQAMTECDELDQNSSRIGDWVDGQVTRAKKIQRNGEELNAFFLPEFIDMLSLRAKEFPLWTSVGMDYDTPHATSSYIEGYFNDIKTRVLKTGPMRVDKFLIKHARDIHGATLLFSSSMINYNVKRYLSPQSPCSVEEKKKKRMEEEINESDKQSDELHSILESTENYNAKRCVQSPISMQGKREEKINDSHERFDELHSILENTENYKTIRCVQSPNSMQEKIEEIINDSHERFDELYSILENTENYKTIRCVQNPNSMQEKIEEKINDSHERFDELYSTLENTENESLDTKGVSYFIEMPSNEIVNYLEDSDLLAVENWRGKVQVNDNFDYNDPEDLNEKIVISNHIKSESNLKEESKSRSISSTHLVSKSKELQICHRKTKKISKYFMAYPEIRQRNDLVEQKKKKKKSTLLPHGLFCPPIKMKENKGEIKSYSVTNTCAFDSIVHVLMTGAIDDVNYYAFLEVSSNPTLQFVCNLIKKGVTQYVLRQRTSILKSYYACKPQVQTDLRVVSYTIDALDNVANVVRKILSTEPSIKNTTKCTSCKGMTYPTVVLAPSHKIIGKEGFESLEKSLLFQSPIYQVRCNDPCLGKYTWFREPTIHIFIELDIRPNLQSTSMSCRLDQMPTTLKLQSENTSFEYRLIGVIGYISGHYIAYCLRSSGVWQAYNDLQTNVNTCCPKTTINPHLVIYMKLTSL